MQAAPSIRVVSALGGRAAARRVFLKWRRFVVARRSGDDAAMADAVARERILGRAFATIKVCRAND